jgi:hypothetical protein
VSLEFLVVIASLVKSAGTMPESMTYFIVDCWIVTAVLVAVLAPFADPSDGGSSAPTPRGIDHA